MHIFYSCFKRFCGGAANINRPLLAWGTLSLFFMAQYSLRVFPNVMITPLRMDFQVNADDFATLGSYYLYTYALIQIPLGFLVDRFGVRSITLISLLLCFFGVLMCSETYPVMPEYLSTQMQSLLVKRLKGCL